MSPATVIPSTIRDSYIFYDYMYILLGLGFCDVLVPAKKIKIKGNAQ